MVDDSILAEPSHKPQEHPLVSARLLFLFMRMLFKKALSVRIESPFVIGLPYSTVI